ncbi:MAG: hypothetical protein R2863_00210 [Candidatus Kapaibacterium sp.]|nr:hypothetical protein [Ignavibacteriota bacterium]MCB9220345.1 hypothetical protein [Ignavibacteria bacterium]
MNKRWIKLLLITISCSTIPRTPVNGTYDYRIEFAEFVEGAMTVPCKVQFKDDSVYVINTEDSFLGTKGDIIEAGIFARHKSGKMIIQHNESDIYEEEVRGCSGGPSVIDTVEKIYWMCYNLKN